LKTDYLDIVLVHSNGEDQHLIEQDQVFATLAALKQQGKLRAFGMSTKTISGGLLTIDQADVAMVSFHPNYIDEGPVIAYAKQQQKGIFIKKALASGHLPGASLSAQDALRFTLKQPGVTSIIIGTINPQHLRENVEAGESA
jgi:aryl-alcohol dehydrogenase-like predicted oxidoreductase